METTESRWANNHGVRLHYLVSASSDPSLTPVVLIPGAFGSAESYESEFAAFAPRRCVAISLRGRGQSDAPHSGYTIRHHATDIAAVVDHADLPRFTLMAYSVGVPYAIRYYTQGAPGLAGLILADYPARLPQFTTDWVERVQRLLSPDIARPHVVDALKREASAVELWDELDGIRCPVLLLRGTQEGALLSAEHVEQYRRHLPQAEVVEFWESGHELWRPNYERYIVVIKDFLGRINGAHESAS